LSTWTIDERFTFQTRVVCHHCGEHFSFNQPSYNKLDKFPASCPKCEGKWGIANKDYRYSKNYWALRAEPLKKKIKEKVKKARKKAREEELEKLEELAELETELDAIGEEEIEAELDAELEELGEEELEKEEVEELTEAGKEKIYKELMQVRGIGKKTAQKIVELGVTSIEELATLEVDMIPETADVSTETLRKWIKNAQKYLKEEEDEEKEEETEEELDDEALEDLDLDLAALDEEGEEDED
jgi:predicted flap endonuclease-1-like 5' DNA nuclease